MLNGLSRCGQNSPVSGWLSREGLSLMDLTVLRLRQLLNTPKQVPLGTRVLKLANDADGPVIVLDPDLARKVLLHKDAAPFDLWAYYLAVTGLTAAEVPMLTRYFAEVPLLQHGQGHRANRKAASGIYKKIEADQVVWLASGAPFEGLRLGAPDAVDVFCQRVFKRMVSVAADIDTTEIPDLPANLFDLLPTRSALCACEADVAVLVDVLERHLAENEAPQTDVWTLLTFVLMGYDALRSSMHYDLATSALDTAFVDAEQWFRHVAPIGILPRQFSEPTTILSHRFEAGQVLYVCPHLVHKADDATAESGRSPSLSFGLGAHSCPGRRLACNSVEAYFERLPSPRSQPRNTAGSVWRRDLILIEKRRKNV